MIRFEKLIHFSDFDTESNHYSWHRWF